MKDQDLVNMNEVEFRHLRYFLAVAEELHFGRAAEKLHIAQPPLSQQIKQLEEWMGYALFVRDSRNVRLTGAGEELRKRLLPTVKKLETDIRAARQRGRGEIGSLAVGFIGSAILTPLAGLLKEYRTAYPEVNLDLQEFYTSTLIDALHEERVDVGFLRDAGEVEGLVLEELMTEPFYAVVGIHHPLAAKKQISIAELRREPFVLFAAANGQGAWRKTIGLCEAHGFTPHIAQEGPHWVTIMRLVGAGLGVTIAPECVTHLAGPDAVRLALTDANAESSLELACREGETCTICCAFGAMTKRVFARESPDGSKGRRA